MLRKHLRLTGSPRAAGLLNDSAPLPFLRVEPLALPCSVAETWATILSRLKRPAATTVYAPRPVASETLAVVMKEGKQLTPFQTGLV